VFAAYKSEPSTSRSRERVGGHGHGEQSSGSNSAENPSNRGRGRGRQPNDFSNRRRGGGIGSSPRRRGRGGGQTLPGTLPDLVFQERPLLRPIVSVPPVPTNVLNLDEEGVHQEQTEEFEFNNLVTLFEQHATVNEVRDAEAMKSEGELDVDGSFSSEENIFSAQEASLGVVEI